MAFARKYEREIMESEEGKNLYDRWSKSISKNTDSPEFATFLGFYNWAMETGFTVEAMLHRRDPKAPFSPDNCVWSSEKKCDKSYYAEFAMKWNTTVNRIRRYYGMEPFRVKTETCPAEVEDSG